MENFALVFVAGMIGVLGGGISMKLRSKAFAKNVSSCPACGREVGVSPDPGNSRLVLQCESGDCGETSFFQVRASAMSLLGLARLVLAIPVAAACYQFAVWLDWIWWAKLLSIGGLLTGWVVVSLLVSLCAHILFEQCPYPIMQNEVVAHLAPRPWRQGQEND